MVVDTDVLIWYMKGNQNAYKIIENLKHFSISVVTYMELVQGMRNKNELIDYLYHDYFLSLLTLGAQKFFIFLKRYPLKLCFL